MATATRTAKASIFRMSGKQQQQQQQQQQRQQLCTCSTLFCTFLGRCFSLLQRKAIIKLPSLDNSRFLRINRHM